MSSILGMNFSITLDKRQAPASALHFTDTGLYSPGIALNFTGYYTVLQPDGILATNGSFASPSIFWSGGSLTSPLSELRFNTANTFQSGNYTINYYLRCPGFTDTVLTKTFYFSYTAPLVVLTPSFDLFTPQLQTVDETNYLQTGMTLGSTTRAWSALIKTVLGTPQTITSSAVEFDMNYAGGYYDSEYDVSLTANPVFTLDGMYNWVTLIDNLVQTATYFAQIPPTISALDADMEALKNELDANVNNTNTYQSILADWLLATSLYSDFRRRGCDGLMQGLDTTLYQLLKIFNNNVNPTYVNTNTLIPAYNFECGGSSGSVAWTSITGKPATANIEWVVGAGGFPGNGATSMTDARFANAAVAQIVFFRNGQPQFSSNPGDGNTYYTKVSTASNTISFSTALNTGEEMKIVIIAL